jgi:hypothetical protein
MEVLVDVVKGEGVAKGRAWPLYLVLGEDAVADVKAKCASMLDSLNAWQDIAGLVRIDSHKL